MAEGARVASVDLSAAVEANARNAPPGPEHLIAQADLRALPFPDRAFDVVICLGVLQHTPNPEIALAHIFRHVKPGGYLVVDHYRRNLRWDLSLQPAWRSLLKRLPPDRSVAVTERVVNALYPYHARSRTLDIVLSRVSPVQTYFRKFPSLSEHDQRQWALLDTHDAMTDRYKHFRTVRSIRRALEQLPGEIEYCARGGNGVEARLRRAS